MDHAAVASLKKEEGLSLKAYQDTLGVWTIGYGRNLQTLEVTELEAERWLHEDYNKALELSNQIPEYKDLSENRKRVITAMVFQLGLRGVYKFKKMRDALRHERYSEAGEEMLDSKWAEQTPARAGRMANRLVADTWPNLQR